MADEHDGPRVVYKKMGDIEMYGVTPDELRQLEKGAPSDTLTFAMASLSACISLVLALFGGTFPDQWFLGLVAAAAVTGLQGLRWLVKGLREKKSNKTRAQEIRERHLPEGTSAPELSAAEEET